MASKQTIQDNNGNDIHPITLANAVFNKKLNLLSGQISEYERNISDFLQRMSKSNQELRALKLKANHLLSIPVDDNKDQTGDNEGGTVTVDPCILLSGGYLNTDSPAGELKTSHTSVTNSTGSYALYTAGTGIRLWINPNNTDAVVIATYTTGTIDFSQYTKIDVIAYSTAGNGGKNLSVGLAKTTQTSNFYYNNISFDNSSTVTLTSSAATYTFDISSWTETGSLIVWSYNNNHDYANTWISEIKIY